ncbi:hypothetical protein GCM10011506_10820 [Marivirga lumbricoides]|uniref:histidine kinase n=2 Tax=Marivirga lumbricoides TaxID=1046115 RepID=A0ABQ1LNI5_9BACT|nr:hypothetical protein GCM10011506_10820 [Marivirga lumbricoides]
MIFGLPRLPYYRNKFVLVLVLIQISSIANSSAESWDQILRDGSGRVTIFYFPIEPFVYRNHLGEIEGVEKEIMDSFFRFVEKKYKVKIHQDWVEVNAFEDLVDNVANCKSGAFGISIISRTEERAKSVAFSNAYMPDVSVLITHISVPLLQDTSMLINHLRGLKAATISNTTYQYDLQKLSNDYALDFSYIESENDENVIDLVSRNRDIIGYVGLPFYVIELNSGKQVKRQPNFQIKRDGYRFIYQHNKGWDRPVKDYFASYLYKAEADKIIRKYLGNEYSELIWGIAGGNKLGNQSDEINFLTREKELQSRSLLASQNEQELQRVIIVSISIGLTFIFFIALLLIKNNRIKARENVLLTEKSQEMQKLFDQVKAQKDEITSQRQLLQKKNNELLAINKQKDELIGIVAHDLKSPINQMSGLINLIGFKNDSWEEEEVKIYEKLEAANRHLKELVERILDLEAIGKKAMNYNITVADMVAVMFETYNDFKEKADYKGILISTSQLSGELPVLADPFFLRQVFENLLSNAIKFSQPGTTIYLASDFFDEYCHISIRDEGPGISKRDQDKLFNKYQTLSARPTGDESSTGLGLSIVKKYVEEMNGSVWCESKLGKGATFVVAFQKV